LRIEAVIAQNREKKKRMGESHEAVGRDNGRRKGGTSISARRVLTGGGLCLVIRPEGV